MAMQSAVWRADSQKVSSPINSGSERLLVADVIQAFRVEAPGVLPSPRPAVDDVPTPDWVDMPSLYRELHGLNKEECDEQEPQSDVPSLPRGFR
jgi:hypothetical protein